MGKTRNCIDKCQFAVCNPQLLMQSLFAHLFANRVLFHLWDIFRLCPPPPQLLGCILFASPDTRVIYLHSVIYLHISM